MPPPLKHFIVSISLILILITLARTTSAQESAKPFPSGVEALSLEITAKGLNKLTMVPTGVHTDEDTRFIFSGHQKGGMASALLFGIPGVIISSEINSTRGQKHLNKIELSQANLVEAMALAAVQSTFEKLDSNPLVPASEQASPKHVLALSPYATLIQSKDDGTKLHAMLVAKLSNPDAPDKYIWRSQFYGEADGILDEETLKNPDLLYQRVEQAFERAAWGLARIVSDDFDTYEPVMAKGWLAWFKKPGELPCIILQSSQDNTLLRLPFGAIVAGTGYNTVATSTLSAKPLKKLKDKFKPDFER